MAYGISRRAFITGAGALSLAALAGCGSSDPSTSASSPSATSASASAGASAPVKVGTLATEDILPFWVAQEEGLFEQEGLDVEVVQFQSATELIAGIGSGEVDMAMTDIMVAASVFAGGTDLRLEWVTLGESADQGRFGIMVGPDSDVEELTDLAGVPIGVGTNTILEYVMDRLMEDVGVSDDQIVVEELQKLPVRYQTMVSGDVAAAALPGSLLALGEANGCRTIADDTAGENLSQSVMAVRESFYDAAADALAGMKAVWDKAAEMVNADPESYRGLLVTNANLSDEVADTYPISTYPTCKVPTDDMVEPVLEWMEEKGYLTVPLSYDEGFGSFEK